MFGFFKKPGKFVDEKEFEINLKSQVEMTPLTLEQLAQLDIDESKQLKLEYFFYTNTPEKAQALATELASRGYEGVAERSAHSRKVYVINGWTQPMDMSNNTVTAWTKDMCEIGFKHDCEFDGWGTTPEQ